MYIYYIYIYFKKKLLKYMIRIEINDYILYDDT